MYRHLFGPVPSRRLGLSLGVDLLSDKTCSFDCVFCEVGRTRDLTLDRKEYVSPEVILNELGSWVDGGGTADHITLAGKGEPTLNTGFGDVIRGIREISQIPVAVLSNGSLFFLEEVRNDAAEADIVKVSLGAWDQESMDALNRPFPGVRFDDIIDGYGAFRSAFSGELWLEVLLVHGINDHVENVARIAEFASSFAPNCIHLNTVVRPGAEDSALPVSSEKMQMLARLFDPPGEVVVSFKPKGKGVCADIREILIRRPCTLHDLAKVSGIEEDAVMLLIKEHGSDWGVESREMNDGTYYMIQGVQE